MRLTWRDAATTALTGTLIALYWAHLADAGASYLTGVRAVAAAGLVLGVAGCILGASAPNAMRPKSSGYLWMAGLGVVALVAGVIALITGGGVVLAVQVAATVLLWLFATVRHAIAESDWHEHVPAAR